MEVQVGSVPVHGCDVDARTGCAHYRSALDIVAIKFACCRQYYACIYCHEAEARHPAAVWLRREFDEKAILCGACGDELTIRQYLASDARCPRCGAGFNPGCAAHYHFYFEMP